MRKSYMEDNSIKGFVSDWRESIVDKPLSWVAKIKQALRNYFKFSRNNSSLEEDVAELIEEHGNILLSGILQEQAQNVVEAAQAKGLRMNEQKQMGDWIALTMSR